MAQDWWMYHGNAAHTGYVSDSAMNAATVNQNTLTEWVTLMLDGPILSVPAVVDGFVYVGIANSHSAQNSNGGKLYKIDIALKEIVATFSWNIAADERDSHGFTGMGTTPAVADGRVYFAAFNGIVYCLSTDDLSLIWSTNLRHPDPSKQQYVDNTAGIDDGDPPGACWSSPVVVRNRIYLGFGEGENWQLFGFVYCLDAETGAVDWLFCTCKFDENADNQPNVIPPSATNSSALPPAGSKFTVAPKDPSYGGSSVWGAIAYDADLNRLYVPTGNSVPDGPLPVPPYSVGILALDADTGDFQGFFSVPKESSYRQSDIDVDIGASPTLFTGMINGEARKLVGVGCKNGSFFILDAQTLECLHARQLLPSYNDGTQIPTVDPHGPDDQSNPNPRLSNDYSNKHNAENFSGIYSTAAVDPASGRLFVGIGGNNYHYISPGIDHETTPFMRALDWETLADAWPMDSGNPPKYTQTQVMYATVGEAGLSSPAVVNDVVFCATSKVSVYAFRVADGALLWKDDLGMQTGGFNGGYGYCMGPAIWGDYLVVGALLMGRQGGVLRIYKLTNGA